MRKHPQIIKSKNKIECFFKDSPPFVSCTLGILDILMIPREYVIFYKSLKNIKYMLHCALLYHEISKMKTNILHKMYRILWHNSDERD